MWLAKCNEYKHSATGSNCPCNLIEVEAIKAFARERRKEFDSIRGAGGDPMSGSSNPAGFPSDWPFTPAGDEHGGDGEGGRRRKHRRPKTKKHRRKKKLTRRRRTKRR